MIRALVAMGVAAILILLAAAPCQRAIEGAGRERTFRPVIWHVEPASSRRALTSDNPSVARWEVRGPATVRALEVVGQRTVERSVLTSAGLARVVEEVSPPAGDRMLYVSRAYPAD